MQDPNITENTDRWDCGTYQTGPANPCKGQNISVTIFLMAVIFLGGLASAMGVMNIHLLTKLYQQSASADIVMEQATGGQQERTDSFFHSEDGASVQLPQMQDVQTRLGFRAQESQAYTRHYWGLNAGLEVIDIFEAKCGLQVGDILLAVDGQELTTVMQLYEAAQSGEKLMLSVLRCGHIFTVELD